MSEPRLSSQDFQKFASVGQNAILELGKALSASGLDPELQQLVKLRASQINGCAFCTQLHLNESRHMGIAAPKLDLIAVWREAGVFSDSEPIWRRRALRTTSRSTSTSARSFHFLRSLVIYAPTFSQATVRISAFSN